MRGKYVRTSGYLFMYEGKSCTQDASLYDSRSTNFRTVSSMVFYMTYDLLIKRPLLVKKGLEKHEVESARRYLAVWLFAFVNY